MMLRTGSDIKRSGFTLVEVMAAASILAIGALLIYESFFATVDLFGYYSNYLKVAPLADEKVWQIQNSLSLFDRVSPADTVIATDNRFQWEVSFNQIDALKDSMKLYQVDVSCSWKHGNRRFQLSRNGYALYKKP